MWDTSCSKRRCFAHRRKVVILFPDLSNHSYAQEIDNHLQDIDTYYIHSPNYGISGTNRYLSQWDTRRDVCVCGRTFGCIRLSVLRHCVVGRYVPGVLCGKRIVYYTGNTSVGENDGFLYFDFCCWYANPPDNINNYWTFYYALLHYDWRCTTKNHQ